MAFCQAAYETFQNCPVGVRSQSPYSAPVSPLTRCEAMHHLPPNWGLPSTSSCAFLTPAGTWRSMPAVSQTEEGQGGEPSTWLGAPGTLQREAKCRLKNGEMPPLSSVEGVGPA